MAEQYSVVYLYHIFFMHSSVDGHLGCFHVLAIVNTASLALGCLCLHPSVYTLVFSLESTEDKN